VTRTLRAKLVCLALLVALAPACSPFEWEYEELGRFQSPDGMVDAVWARGSGGATTGFVYELFLVPAGTKFDKKDSYFERAEFAGDHLEEFQLVWREPKLLELRFKHARIHDFSNYWRYWNRESPREDSRHVVELRLVHLAEGSTLPPDDRF
jgi:hypothetical protein